MYCKNILLVVMLSSILLSCKQSETLQYEDAKDYYPMTVGKFITYKLDSTNYIGFNVNPVISSYFAKDSIEAKITDNLGRQSYRIVRYMRKLATDAWVPNSTYMVTVLDKSIEVVDNNMRFIKLQNPIRDLFSWKGNSYIESSGAFSQFQYLFDWEYQYAGIKEAKTYTVAGNPAKTFNETVTVNQADATDGIPTDPNGYSERNYSVEVYAKGVGLVYKDFLHWTYQPPSGPTPGYRTGYGIKLTVIANN